MKTTFTALVLILLTAPLAWAEAPSWADYTVTFDATWSAATHPQSFPGNPHFSGLIGGTHHDGVAFWADGALASTGIKQMAEWGSKSALTAEVNAAIGAGQAGVVISGGGIGTSPGQVAVSFTISPEFPLVTLTSMVAPSPDWFVGVAGVNLLVGEEWISELTIDLYAYDAGTDSGVNYTSSDLPTSPADPIAAITGGPFAAGVPLGTLTFRLNGAADVPDAATALQLVAQPNPFNPATVLHFDIPAGAQNAQLTIADIRGRQIRRLKVGTDSGHHSVPWNGVSEDGARLASGVYFVRLAVDGAVAVQKIVLVQ